MFSPPSIPLSQDGEHVHSDIIILVLAQNLYRVQNTVHSGWSINIHWNLKKWKWIKCFMSNVKREQRGFSGVSAILRETWYIGKVTLCFPRVTIMASWEDIGFWKIQALDFRGVCVCCSLFLSSTPKEVREQRCGMKCRMKLRLGGHHPALISISASCQLPSSPRHWVHALGLNEGSCPSLEAFSSIQIGNGIVGGGSSLWRHGHMQGK